MNGSWINEIHNSEGKNSMAHGSNPTLTREAFETSRLLDFFSERELVAQTGHSTAWWPEMVVKELVDNAADAMEQAGTPPTVEITVSDESITVTDIGPGNDGGGI